MFFTWSYLISPFSLFKNLNLMRPENCGASCRLQFGPESEPPLLSSPPRLLHVNMFSSRQQQQQHMAPWENSPLTKLDPVLPWSGSGSGETPGALRHPSGSEKQPFIRTGFTYPRSAAVRPSALLPRSSTMWLSHDCSGNREAPTEGSSPLRGSIGRQRRGRGEGGRVVSLRHSRFCCMGWHVIRSGWLTYCLEDESRR